MLLLKMLKLLWLVLLKNTRHCGLLGMLIKLLELLMKLLKLLLKLIKLLLRLLRLLLKLIKLLLRLLRLLLAVGEAVGVKRSEWR